MKEMSKWERVRATLQGAEVDRVPLSLWKHYHLQDRAPRRLAEVSIALYRQFDTDLIKLTPSGLYPIQDWGATIQFGRDDDFLPLAVHPVIEKVEDWETLPKLDVTKGALGRELEMLHYVAAGLDGSAPFMMTIFSPLNIAYKLCGDKLSGDKVVEYLREAPKQVHTALNTITDVVIEYTAACLEAGASGIFFATQMATRDLMTRPELAEFGIPYDLKVLESIAGKSQVTMLHICQSNLNFDMLADYPVDIINWDDRGSGTTLTDARRMTKTPLAGGLSLDTLLNGSEEDVIAEGRDAVEQVGRTGLMLAPGCVVKGPSPNANLAAARRFVEETRLA